jgi:hypothetical protein
LRNAAAGALPAGRRAGAGAGGLTPGRGARTVREAAGRAAGFVRLADLGAVFFVVAMDTRPLRESDYLQQNQI